MNRADQILTLMKSDKIDFEQLEAALDAANHRERVTAMYKMSTKIQRRLFDQAKGRAVTLQQIMPWDDLYRPVHHWGKNTIAPGFDRFQKRFCRVAGHAPTELIGYNEDWYRFAISPGYYVAYMDEAVGELVVDYTRLPEDRPPEFPRILPNWVGLGSVIFLGMQDRLRYVSEHMTIGRAYKGGKALNNWFVLVREA